MLAQRIADARRRQAEEDEDGRERGDEDQGWDAPPGASRRPRARSRSRRLPPTDSRARAAARTERGTTRAPPRMRSGPRRRRPDRPHPASAERRGEAAPVGARERVGWPELGEDRRPSRAAGGLGCRRRLSRRERLEGLQRRLVIAGVPRRRRHPRGPRDRARRSSLAACRRMRAISPSATKSTVERRQQPTRLLGIAAADQDPCELPCRLNVARVGLERPAAGTPRRRRPPAHRRGRGRARRGRFRFAAAGGLR